VPVDQPLTALRRQLAGVDIYLIDQLLRGRLEAGTRVLDAGCGRGRNLRGLRAMGCEVFGSDRDPGALESLGDVVASDRLRCEPVELTSFRDMDVVVCNAVLHFAEDPRHFRAMLDGLWSALAPGGMLFARLASSIGLEDRVGALGHGRYELPDGSERYLVDEAGLLALTAELGAELLDPIKTTNVQGLRCMTTWVLRRREAQSG
jgi:tellurite methyltransferase